LSLAKPRINRIENRFREALPGKGVKNLRGAEKRFSMPVNRVEEEDII
jgi:hypothetical protein